MRGSVWLERPHPDYGIWIDYTLISDPLAETEEEFRAKVIREWSHPDVTITFGPIGRPWGIQ
jgi:hypothetical protein